MARDMPLSFRSFKSGRLSWKIHMAGFLPRIFLPKYRPPFDRSPYDGYAFRGGYFEPQGTSPQCLILLRRYPRKDAGSQDNTRQGGKILTGAPIPEGKRHNQI